MRYVATLLIGLITGLAIGYYVPNGERVGPRFDPKGYNSITIDYPDGSQCILSGSGRWQCLDDAYPPEN